MVSSGKDSCRAAFGAKFNRAVITLVPILLDLDADERFQLISALKFLNFHLGGALILTFLRAKHNLDS
jgi:hypothetical protein